MSWVRTVSVPKTLVANFSCGDLSWTLAIPNRCANAARRICRANLNAWHKIGQCRAQPKLNPKLRPAQAETLSRWIYDKNATRDS